MTMKKSQQGVMLLEALIGILIFSMGILAIIGMQARSIASVSDAMFRSQASFLANEIIGQMWVDRGVSLAGLANYAYPPGGSPALATWVAKLQTELPRGAAVIGTNTATGFVTVTITWQPPNATTAHNLTAVAQITNPD
jgi:type IV pilus assembly protein PilV